MMPQQRMPGDRDREQVEVVTQAPRDYRVSVESPIDGVMTREPIGYQAFEQRWRLNRFLRLRNVGTTDVFDPWITINGKGAWRTLGDIAAEAVGTYTSDRDRARAIWEFTRRRRFHATTWDHECNDPVKVFNVYGYTLCGNDARVIAALWEAAGLRTRRGYPVGHSVSEVFYDGAFHLLDGDEHCIYLRRDNTTIASEADVVADHDLIKRTHTYGILRSDDPLTDQFSASLFGYEGERKGSIASPGGHTMNFRLRPAEAIEWRWDHIGREYTAARIMEDGKCHGDGTGSLIAWGDAAYANLRNGLLLYQPDVTDALALNGMHRTENLKVVARGDEAGLCPEDDTRPALVVWRHHSPYVMIGGILRMAGSCRAEAEGRLEVDVSPDASAWTLLGTVAASEAWGSELSLDDLLSPRGKPQYVWWLRVRIPPGFLVGKVSCRTDLQMAALGLPALEAGNNTVHYVDASPEGRRVEITHAWTERPAWHRPGVPAPTAPVDGAMVSGTDVAFSWSEPTHTDGAAIADYHIEVSAFPDMRWPLSPNTEKLLSKTAFRGRTMWRMPGVGLLNPGAPYFWRVRACDERGVWGPWSEPEAFSCKAPGVPLGVRCEADPERPSITLQWRPNPVGERPVKYRVYGSDERGFTASDTPFRKRVGRGFCRDIQAWEATTDHQGTIEEPANLLGETTEPILRVAGPDAAVADGARAFYRVVAVDAAGTPSGPSAQARAPRPFFCTRPEPHASVGALWTYRPTVTRSIGDLQCKPGYKAAYWHAESLTFSLVEGPDWLQLDPASGQLSGHPAKAGKERVVLRVVNSRNKKAVQRIDLNIHPEAP